MRMEMGMWGTQTDREHRVKRGAQGEEGTGVEMGKAKHGDSSEGGDWACFVTITVVRNGINSQK